MKLCVCVCLLCPQMLLEVVTKTLKHHGISAEHECFEACSKRLFDISKFYLKVSVAHTQPALSSPPLCVCFSATRTCCNFWTCAVFCYKSSTTNYYGNRNDLKTPFVSFAVCANNHVRFYFVFCGLANCNQVLLNISNKELYWTVSCQKYSDLLLK